jgi:CheY-like chemotaxis protein
MKPVIAVVDDDDDLRETICEAIRDLGYEVAVCARDGADALESLRQLPAMPHVILLDLMMPRMDGWQFRAAQLADDVLRGIPVVVMTASRNLAERPIDAAAFLEKPLRLGTLVDAAERFALPRSA